MKSGSTEETGGEEVDPDAVTPPVSPKKDSATAKYDLLDVFISLAFFGMFP